MQHVNLLTYINNIFVLLVANSCNGLHHQASETLFYQSAVVYHLKEILKMLNKLQVSNKVWRIMLNTALSWLWTVNDSFFYSLHSHLLLIASNEYCIKLSSFGISWHNNGRHSRAFIQTNRWITKNNMLRVI